MRVNPFGKVRKAVRSASSCWPTANDLWELGSGGKERSHRPVFMAYAGTDQGSRAFSANLGGWAPGRGRGSGQQWLDRLAADEAE